MESIKMRLFNLITGFIAWVKEQVEWFKSFFGEVDTIDNQKKPSIKKAGTAVVFVVFAKSYLTLAMKDDKMPDIPETWFWIILGILGIGTVNNLAGNYIAKKSGENNVQK